MKKVLFVSSETVLGGAEKCLQDLLVFYSRQSEVEIQCVFFSEGPLAVASRRLGFGTHILPMPLQWRHLGKRASTAQMLIAALGALVTFPPFFWRLRRLMGILKPDVIYSNNFKAQIFMALFRWRRHIFHLHDLPPQSEWGRRFLWRWAPKGSVAIANSDYTLEAWRPLWRSGKLFRVYNGVDLQKFSPRFSSPAINSSEAVVGLVATYADWKGHELFLDAIALLGDTQARFFIVGGPIYATRASQVTENQLRESIEHRKLGERVTLIPFQSAIEDWIGTLDIVVHASTRPEPFGRVIAEAMAAGRAVVASSEGGAQELFVDGESALGFKPRSAMHLSQRIRELIDNPGERKRLGENARREAARRFDIAQYQTGISEVIRATLAGHGIVVAMGYWEDGWHSSRTLMHQLARGISQVGKSTVMAFAPALGHSPRWWDRRLLYSRRLPRGEVFHLMDQSYADSVHRAHHRFERTVVTVHDLCFWNARNFKNRVFRARIVSGLRKADTIVTDSDAVSRELESRLGIRTDAVIPPGVPLGRFPYCERARTPGMILFVGIPDERKGFDRACRILSGLPEDFSLVHAGPIIPARMRHLIRRLGVGARLTSVEHPSAEMILSLYTRAHCLLVPSRYEGYGLTPLEARLCGTQVLASSAVPSVQRLTGDAGLVVLDEATPQFEAKATQTILNLAPVAVPFVDRQSLDWSHTLRAYQTLYERDRS